MGRLRDGRRAKMTQQKRRKRRIKFKAKVKNKKMKTKMRKLYKNKDKIRNKTLRKLKEMKLMEKITTNLNKETNLQYDFVAYMI